MSQTYHLNRDSTLQRLDSLISMNTSYSFRCITWQQNVIPLVFAWYYLNHLDECEQNMYREQNEAGARNTRRTVLSMRCVPLEKKLFRLEEDYVFITR